MGLLNTMTSVSGVQHGSEMEESMRQDGGLDGNERLLSERPEFHIHAYTDASFSTSGGEVGQDFLSVWLFPKRASIQSCNGPRGDKQLLLIQQPEAEIVAMSEGIMTSILTYDAAEFLGVCVWV